MLIRPETAILPCEGCPPGADNVIEGTLVEQSFRGDHYRLLVRHADGLEMAFMVEAMRRLGTKTAFVFDHHFEEQRFECLP